MTNYGSISVFGKTVPSSLTLTDLVVSGSATPTEIDVQTQRNTNGAALVRIGVDEDAVLAISDSQANADTAITAGNCIKIYAGKENILMLPDSDENNFYIRRHSGAAVTNRS